MSIALNMIIGKWEEPFLKPAIASCRNFCDEFVFIDTAPGRNPNRNILEEFMELENEELAIYGTGKLVKIIDMPRGEDCEFSFAEARELARKNTSSEWVLRLDADEILHQKDIEALKEATQDPKYDAIEVAFYHFMVYPWLYQYIEPKVVLMRTNSFSWTRGVHEVPQYSGRTMKAHEIKYFHMGYCRGQAEVFKRWQLYVDIDGRSDWYKDTNPDTILEDRISVCQNFTGSFPKVLEPALDELFPNWREMYEGN